MLNNLQEVGIRAKLRPLERAAFFKGYAEKKLQEHHPGLVAAPSATPRPGWRPSPSRAAPTSMAAIPRSTTLFAEQAVELDVAKRTAHAAQDAADRAREAIYAPIWQLAFINGVGKRVGESGLGLIRGHAYSAPYEDVTIKQT